MVDSDVHREGITGVSAADVAYASRLGYSVKLLAIAELIDGGPEVSVRVHPAMVPKTHPLAAVRGAFNAVFVEGAVSGELMLYGRGAGGGPTASAMLGDLVDASRNLLAGAPAPAPKRTSTTIRSQNDMRSAFYLSMDVADRPGVLAAVAKIFGDHDVSIRAMEQVGLAEEARLIFLTHVAREGDLLATIDELRRHQAVDRVSGVLRVIGQDGNDGDGRRRGSRRSGRHTVTAGWRGVMEEYRDFLPITARTPVVTLLEGGTPLLPAPRLSERVGAEVWLKVEGVNPTGSFKDRGMTMAISMAVDEGAKAVVCASTGNTSASAAAYASRAGLACVVLIPDGHIALGKLAQALMHGARVLQVRGNFDQLLTIVRDLPNHAPITVVNSVNPHRIEGQKTGAFEIVDVLGDAPDVHCIPVGNAGNISAYWRGYLQYKEAGRSTRVPRMLGFQAAGAAPIVLGHPVENPETIASAIRIGEPGRLVLGHGRRVRVRRLHHGSHRRRDPGCVHVPRPPRVRLLRGGFVGVSRRAHQAWRAGGVHGCLRVDWARAEGSRPRYQGHICPIGDRPRSRFGIGRNLSLNAFGTGPGTQSDLREQGGCWHHPLAPAKVLVSPLRFRSALRGYKRSRESTTQW